MKYLKIVNEILICIVLILCIFCMFKYVKRNKYDLNDDGVVNSADLLKLRQYLIEETERNDIK